jgi:tRNA(Ile)-lysidine synthase TilS/MesJ
MLFSGGQDSTSFFFLTLLQRKNAVTVQFLFQHEMQIHTYSLVDHGFSLQFLFPGFFSFSGLKKNPRVVFPHEEFLRFSRYQITLRLVEWYRRGTFVTGHTESDWLETFCWTWLRNPTNPNLFLPTFSPKILLERSYFKDVGKRRGVEKRSVLVFGLKTKGIQFSTGRKKTKKLSRPFQYFSRLSLKESLVLLNLPFFLDFSNFSFLIPRNRIRRHLLVYLHIFFWRCRK